MPIRGIRFVGRCRGALDKKYRRPSLLAGKNPKVDIRLIATWSRAMRAGVAATNPYDGIAAGQIDLWVTDHHHGSNYGYGLDPRYLGSNERTASEMGFSARQVAALPKGGLRRTLRDQGPRAPAALYLQSAPPLN